MDNAEPPTPTCDTPAVPQPTPAEAVCSIQLTERDAAAVLAAADNPPGPNEAALRAAMRFAQLLR